MPPPVGPPRRLLLVLAHGVGPEAVEGLGLPPQPTAALRLPAHPVERLLSDLDASRELDDLGITVDRSALLLRPMVRTDATAVDALSRRATGPAEVILFEARDVLGQAMRGAHAAAAAAQLQLGALLERLQTILRRGDAPELWFVGLGTPVPVERTVDLATLWRQWVLAPLADDLTLHVTPGEATIRGDNQRALDLAAHALARRPFAPDGVLAPAHTGMLRFVAAPGIAFGRERLAARAPLPHEAMGVVQAPLGDLARRADLGFADVMARFWLRAVGLHGAVDEAAEPQAIARRTSIDEAVAPAAPAAPQPFAPR